VAQFQAIKQIPAYQSAVTELLDPERYVLLRCGDEPVLDEDTGGFAMGPDYWGDDRAVEVTLTQRFGVSKYQLMHEQFSVWDNIGPGAESNLPATEISWLDCYFFLVSLSSERVKLPDGREYRFDFPTDAQWEYACRAGSTAAYCYGDDEKELTQYAWYEDNRNNRPHPVGEKKPNAWELYDMHGNVWEWCWDKYGAYPSEPVTDPVGPKGGSYRVFRGGCWFIGAAYCRSAYRRWNDPSYRSHDYGFRVALSSYGIPRSPEADK
jgi:formylglycine-generating enzyme required for sulfatase activity